MATRTMTHVWHSKGVLKSTVTGLLNGDQSTNLDAPFLPDKSIQILGTFGVGGSVQVEGSNDAGTTWHILNDSRGEGNQLVFTAADTRAIGENTQLKRLNVTAGDGTTSLSAYIMSQSPNR